jgi:hypothetical protein
MPHSQFRIPPLGFRLAALLLACLALAGCSDLERTAYRVLAVTGAEFEAEQQRVAEAAAHGFLTEEQWNRFQVEAHRFIDAHNAAVDAFQLWSRTKRAGDVARLEAMLEILPRLIREIESLVSGFLEKPQPAKPDDTVPSRTATETQSHRELMNVSSNHSNRRNRPAQTIGAARVSSGGHGALRNPPPLPYGRGSEEALHGAHRGATAVPALNGI